MTNGMVCHQLFHLGSIKLDAQEGGQKLNLMSAQYCHYGDGSDGLSREDREKKKCGLRHIPT